MTHPEAPTVAINLLQPAGTTTSPRLAGAQCWTNWVGNLRRTRLQPTGTSRHDLVTWALPRQRSRDDVASSPFRPAWLTSPSLAVEVSFLISGEVWEQAVKQRVGPFTTPPILLGTPHMYMAHPEPPIVAINLLHKAGTRTPLHLLQPVGFLVHST